MRAAKESDFFVTLPGVGVFRFGRRTFGDVLAIRATFLRLVAELGENDVELSTRAACIATHRVMCVSAPPGWEDLEALDMVAAENADDKVADLYLLLKEKEDSLRSGETKSGAPGGA